MSNVSDKSCRENQNTFYFQYLIFENRAVYEILWKNIVERGRPQMTWHMRIPCWITKAINTNIHSEYVVLIMYKVSSGLRISKAPKFVCIGTGYPPPPRVTYVLPASFMRLVCFSIFSTSFCSAFYCVVNKRQSTHLFHFYLQVWYRSNTCSGPHYIALLPEYGTTRMVPDYLQCIILEMAVSTAEHLFLLHFTQTGPAFHLALYPLGINRRFYTQWESGLSVNLTDDHQLVPKFKLTLSCTSRLIHFLLWRWFKQWINMPRHCCFIIIIMVIIIYQMGE
jgi:hypothetical protein